VHTWDTARDEPRSYRLDRMRKAKVLRKGFTPREGFDISALHHATTARIWYSPAVARWEIEKGAHPLVDGSAVADKSVGSAEWLVGEVVSYRGEAIVLDPADLRAQVAIRARALATELRPARAKA
jgi:proteasome accessory factor C